jgi:hypothetical protein
MIDQKPMLLPLDFSNSQTEQKESVEELEHLMLLNPGLMTLIGHWKDA